jgi:hypothetical protein
MRFAKVCVWSLAPDSQPPKAAARYLAGSTSFAVYLNTLRQWAAQDPPLSLLLKKVGMFRTPLTALAASAPDQ